MIDDLTQLARCALERYGLASGAAIELLSYSENAIFKITAPSGSAPVVLRVHRPGYHSRNALQSELDWMAALRDAGIATPRSIACVDGAHLQEVRTPALGARIVDVFAWIEGRFPDERELEPYMRRLGQLSARMHAHARAWRRPPYFERLVWDHAGTIGPDAHWGRWDASPDLVPDDIAVLHRTTQRIGARLAAFGQGPERFGLIHADQRLANLLVDGDTTHIIDFDDCGLGWFLHDLAAALSFIEHRPECPLLVDRWLEGYSLAGTLGQAEIDEVPTFIMQRRLQLLAWRGSHFETDLARSLGRDWVAATAQMGAKYLRNMA